MTSLTLPKSVQSVISTFHKSGFEIYAVGGAVRDMLMNKQTKDWDFTSNATPEEMLKLFPDSFYNNQFGTVGIPQKKGEIYEVTTYRTETEYSDRRRPDTVSWGKTLKEDIARRDFTINAIALRQAQGTQSSYELIDYYNGQEDIKNKLIRAVGDPDKRFKEDALRLLRAIRIATELQFMIEPTTQKAMITDAHLINHVSGERIKTELLRIITSLHGADGILLLKNTGLLAHILPELEACFSVDQKSPKRHHIYDVGTHLVESLRACKDSDPITRFAVLLHDIGKPQVVKTIEDGVITFYNHEVAGTKIARRIAGRLKLSKKEREKLLTLIRWHQFSVDEHQTDSAIRRFIRRIGKENIDAMLHLRTADRIGGGAKETSWRTELFKKRLDEVQQQPFSVTDLKVNGNDVIDVFKVKPGPIVGETLEKLFAEVEEDLEKNTREYLLKRLEEMKEEK